MLLSETLKIMIDEMDITSLEKVTACCKIMIQLCFGKLEDELRKTPNDNAMISNFKMINNIWNLTVSYADKTGKPVLKKDGFRDLVRSKKEFELIHNLI